MNKRVVAVVVCTLLALVAASLAYVPMSLHERLAVEQIPPDELETMRRDAYRHSSHNYPDPDRLDPLFRGEWLRLDSARHPTRWDGVWGGRHGGGMEFVLGDHIEWPLAVWQPLVAILLGGGLLTYVVRRERRRKAAA